MADTKAAKKTTSKATKQRPGTKSKGGKAAPKKRPARKPQPTDSIRPHFFVREELLLAARDKGEETGLGQKSVPHIVRIGLTEYVQRHADQAAKDQFLPLPVQNKLRALSDATKKAGAPREVAHAFNAYLAALREAGYSLANIGPFLDVTRQRIHQRADAGEARAKKLGEPLPQVGVEPAGAKLREFTAQVDRSFPMKRSLYEEARRISNARGEALSDVVDEILYSYVNGDLEVTTRRQRTMDVAADVDTTPKAV